MRSRRAALVIGDLPKHSVRALEERGFLVEFSDGAPEAEKKYKIGGADVCILVAQKKEMMQMMARLKDASQRRVVPIVAVRVPGGEHMTKKDAVEMGADAYVSALNEVDFVEVVENAASAMGGVVPEPENDAVVEKVFDIVRNLGKNGRIGAAIGNEPRSSQKYSVRSLEQLIETVEKELSCHPEVTRRVTSPLEKEEIDVLDVEAEIEPLLAQEEENDNEGPQKDKREQGVSGEEKKETDAENDTDTDSDNDTDNAWIVENIFKPLYRVLGLSLGAEKEEITEAYAVRSDRIRKVRADKADPRLREDTAVWKSAQRALDSAFDVLSKEAVRNIATRSKLDKKKSRD